MVAHYTDRREKMKDRVDAGTLLPAEVFLGHRQPVPLIDKPSHQPL